MGSQREITAYQYLDVWLVEVLHAGADARAALDLTVQLALAECPLGLVCALPPDAAAEEPLLTTLAGLGRHVARWPATPVVVVWADDEGWAEVAARPDGRHLRRSSSLLHAWSQLHAGAAQRMAFSAVPGNALASRAARAFLTRTCRDWRVPQHLEAGTLVVSELVTNAVQHTDGDVDVQLAEHDGRLRVAVRDRGDAPPVTPAADLDRLSGRGLRIVETLAATSGALPAAGGGKVVWAVLDPVGVRIGS
jgi:anti-sigma regulatory factor (Ser/Thr protein kinase)